MNLVVLSHLEAILCGKNGSIYFQLLLVTLFWKTDDRVA